MRSYVSDHRTPMAWHHRDIALHPRNPRYYHRHNSRGPPSPSETTSSSGDEREEVPMVRGMPSQRHHHHHHHHHNHHPSSSSTLQHLHQPNYRRPASRCSRQQYHREGHSQFTVAEPPLRNGGTLRSTRSVPALALATWDGEPCPVHGHGVPLYHPPPPVPISNGSLRRHGSLFDVRGAYYPPYPPPPPHFAIAPPPALDKKSFHGSLQMLGPMPPHFLPPLMRPRPFVIPAGAEPLPMRDPYKSRTPPLSGYAGSKGDDSYSDDQICCKGHLIVLWIILAVVTIGVILGIVLGVTIA